MQPNPTGTPKDVGVNYSGTRFLNKAPRFSDPTGLPPDAQTAEEWQAANKAWWESTPMRYNWRDEIPAEPGTRAFFEEIDRRFYQSVRHFMPWEERPFDNLIAFERLRSLAVLEIGVGQGSHAELIAPFCGSFTGIDLTQAGAETTAQRLEQAGIEADIRQMDAERMAFEDASFDFIWSWGVIHHSSNPRRILEEMHRVLRPGGRAVVMVYHRSWSYYLKALIQGLLRRDFSRYRSVHEIMQASTDGAIARFYTPQEWRDVCAPWFAANRIEVTGLKTDALPLPGGALKTKLVEAVPDRITRFMTDELAMGTLLIAHMHRKKKLTARLAGASRLATAALASEPDDAHSTCI